MIDIYDASSRPKQQSAQSPFEQNQVAPQPQPSLSSFRIPKRAPSPPLIQSVQIGGNTNLWHNKNSYNERSGYNRYQGNQERFVYLPLPMFYFVVNLTRLG